MSGNKNDVLPHILAKIQALQDHCAQYFNASVGIYKKDYTLLTIPSTYANCCNCDQSPDLIPSVYRTFADSMFSQLMNNREPIVTRCPYNVNFMIAPLGYTQSMTSNDAIEYFVVIKKGRETSSNAEFDSVFDNLESDNFEEDSAIILSCLDTVFSVLQASTIMNSDIPPAEELKLSGYENLTQREQEVMHLVSIGLSNYEISKQLFISEHTVKIHIGNILRKTGLKNRTQLAVFEIMNI